MAHSFLTFDFGANEEAAQQARHRIEGWKQAFRLDKKLQVKFDRHDSAAQPDTAPEAPIKASKAAPKGKAKNASKSKAGSKSDSAHAEVATATSDITLIVRLDFSDHEKLSHQRWLERIPAEEPFKTVKSKIVRVGDSDFSATSDLFDSLD